MQSGRAKANLFDLCYKAADSEDADKAQFVASLIIRLEYEMEWNGALISLESLLLGRLMTSYSIMHGEYPGYYCQGSHTKVVRPRSD